MPIYSYKCPDCAELFEAMKKVDDRHTAICPFCSGVGVHVITQVSFSLKGNGWYKDGYGSTPSSKKEE